MSTLTLDACLNHLVTNGIDDPAIYSFLWAVDRERVKTLLARLARIEAAERKPEARDGPKAWKSRKGVIKGQVYEELAQEAIGAAKCFTTWTRVHSTTNEIDVLVGLGPMSLFVPAFRGWGGHLLCECKFHEKAVSGQWVDRLNTVLATHGASVGVLMSKQGIGPRGGAVRTKLQLLANGNPRRYILCLDRADLESCVSTGNLVALLSQRFIEVNAGLRKLGLSAA